MPLNARETRALRQVRPRPVDLAAHQRPGILDFRFTQALIHRDVDLRDILAGGGPHLVHLGQLPDRALDGVGDCCFDPLGVGPRQRRQDIAKALHQRRILLTPKCQERANRPSQNDQYGEDTEARKAIEKRAHGGPRPSSLHSFDRRPAAQAAARQTGRARRAGVHPR